MKTNLLKYITIALIITGCFSSCKEEKYERIDIESGINIKMVEILDTQRRFQLHCGTMEIYYAGYPLIAEHRQSSTKISVTFKHIRTDGFRSYTVGPASVIIDFGALNPGTYQLHLSNRGVTYQGELIVSPETYQIKFIKNDEFHFNNTPLRRVPEHTVWGRICNAREELAQSFFDALIDLGAKKQAYQPGNYGEFKINENGEISLGSTQGQFEQRFIFSYSGNVSEIEQFVKQYAIYKETNIYITVYTDKGEMFYN